MKRNLIRKTIGAFSLTSVLFVFQACYGSPRDFGNDVLIQGQVKSSSSGLPLEGVKVSIDGEMQYHITDEDGNYSFYFPKYDSLKISFVIANPDLNMEYEQYDTILSNIGEHAGAVCLDVSLNEKACSPQ